MESKYREILNQLKKHISLFNSDFILQHIVPKYHFEYCAERNDGCKVYPDKTFEIVFDSEGLSFLNNPQLTNIKDCYLSSLLATYRINREEPRNEDEDNLFLENLYEKAKAELRINYNRDLHIKYLVWSTTKYLTRPQEEKVIIQSLANEILVPASCIHLSELTLEGMTFEILEFSNGYWNVRLKSTEGIFSNFVHYVRNQPFLQSADEIVDIPSFIRNNCFIYTMRIVEVGPGVFNNLPKLRKVVFSRDMLKIDWSFWHCKQLECIEVHKYNYRYKSVDGVLFSGDGKRLIAYPNAHSPEYAVPEGVEHIEKFAFKDCDKLLKLSLPSSIKKIGINAFYRCVNLKSISCDFPKSSVINEGFSGDHRMQHLQWIYKPLKFKTIIKL